MKQLFYLLLLLLLITPSCTSLELDQYATKNPNTNNPEDFKGEGTKSSPYQITSAKELKLLANKVNHGESMANTFFLLTCDIDLEGNTSNKWTPIGNQSNKFYGTFDGGNHLISGILILNDYSYINNNMAGLFGCTHGAEIKNLGVDGRIYADDYVGGISGYSTSTIISNCYNLCIISAKSNVGGIVGESHSVVNNCYNMGEIDGTSNSGGVVGYNYEGSIINCYNRGYLSGTANNNGGIVGNNSEGLVNNCYNVGIISGYSTIGAIAGSNNSIITNCYWLSDGCGDESGIGKSESEMKSDEMVTLLNGEQSEKPWKVDTESVNAGYPILSWQ